QVVGDDLKVALPGLKLDENSYVNKDGTLKGTLEGASHMAVDDIQRTLALIMHPEKKPGLSFRQENDGSVTATLTLAAKDIDVEAMNMPQAEKLNARNHENASRIRQWQAGLRGREVDTLATTKQMT